MKRALLLMLFVSAFCSRETPVTETMDTREPVGIMYVGAPELHVRAQPNDTAAVLSTYQNGEAISIFAHKGDWVEVRTGSGSGWARMSDLTTADVKEQRETSPEPRFRIMPLPVSAPSARGEIYIEADVNTDGDVVNTRLITNTTTSPILGTQNESALRSAKFHPIVIKGKRQAFKYYHRVTY